MGGQISFMHISFIVTAALAVVLLIPIAILYFYKHSVEFLKNRRQKKEKKFILSSLFSKRPHDLSDFSVKSISPNEHGIYLSRNSVKQIVLPFDGTGKTNPSEDAEILKKSDLETQSTSDQKTRFDIILPDQQNIFSDFSFQSVTTDEYKTSSHSPKSSAEQSVLPSDDPGTTEPSKDAKTLQGSVLETRRPSDQETRRPSRLAQLNELLKTFKTSAQTQQQVEQCFIDTPDNDNCDPHRVPSDKEVAISPQSNFQMEDV